MNYTITKDMQSFKKTIDLSQTTDNSILFQGDIPGQIVAVESGKNILVKVSGMQEVSYRKVKTEYGALIKKGKNKGKYTVTTTVYKAVVNNSGVVTGYEEQGTSKVSYSKTQSKTGVITSYQILNAKGKVLDTSTTSYEGENTTILDTSKTLGVITFTNGDKSAVNSFSIGAKNADNATANILTKYYTPAKKKKAYTGNWQNEEVDSTSANETFNLGAGQNIINIDMTQKFGKDSVILSKEGKLTLTMTGAVKYLRSGNNVVVTGSNSTVYEGEGYTKWVRTIKKSGNNYEVVDKYYEWDDGNDEYKSTPKSTLNDTWSQSDFNMYKKSFKDYEHVDMVVGENVWYLDSENNFCSAASSGNGKITLKNYLKNGVDNVYVGTNSLKTILEEGDAAKLGNKDSKKKQKLAGTFLKETFTGGVKNDTITTGSGDDTINLSAGTDSITINGTGKKTLKYVPADAMSGTTTVAFAKNTDFTLTTLDVDNVVSQMDTNGAFVKSGNNLVIGKNVKSTVPGINTPKVHNMGPNVTITNFFGSDDIRSSTIFAYESESPQYFDALTPSVYQFGTAKKANKIADTKYNDVLIGGSKADTFTVSNGNATVYVNPDGDKINVKSDATGTLTVVQNWASNKTGNNTVNIDKDAGLTAITITGSDPQYLGEDGTFAVSFEKTGDDLLYYHDVQVTTNTMGKSLTGTVHLASTTVKNFFNDDEYGLQAKTQFLYGFDTVEQVGDFETALGENALKINSVYNSATKTYEYKGTTHNNTYVYGGKYKSKMTDSDGNDTYNLTINKNSNLTISDSKGSDTIKFNSNVNNLRVFIGDNQDKITLYDKSTFTAANLKKSDDTVVGGVQITEYKRGEGNSYTFKNNKDETIDNFATWIDKVKSDVASWLNNNANYSTVSDVLNSKNTADINNLMKCYTTYEQFTNSLPKT